MVKSNDAAAMKAGRRAVLKGGIGIAAGLSLAEPACAQPKPRDATRRWVNLPPIVETRTGRVRGVRSDGYSMFKGIPYGDTTAGENRFFERETAAACHDFRFVFGVLCLLCVRREDDQQRQKQNVKRRVQ